MAFRITGSQFLSKAKSALCSQGFVPLNCLKLGSSKHASITPGKENKSKELVLEGDSIQRRGFQPLNLNFDDQIKAFKHKTNLQVFRSWMILSLCQINFVVQNNVKLMNMARSAMPDVVFKKFMKATFYGQFVAGETEDEIAPVVKQLESFGVGSILDYSAEEDTPGEENSGNQSDISSKDNTLSEVLGQTCDRDDALRMVAPHEPVVDRRRGMVTARTFFYQGEAQCEKNMEIFLKSIELVDSATDDGFAAIKVTALIRPQLLLQLSEALIRTRRYVAEVIEPVSKKAKGVLLHHVHPDDFAGMLADRLPSSAAGNVQKLVQNMDSDQQGIINLFSWGGLIENELLLSDMFRVPSLKTGKMMPLIDSLTNDENTMFSNGLRRLGNIFQYAKNHKVRVMVDAEQTYFQAAISRLCMESMKKYNTSLPVVYNTYQCYLKNAHSELCLDMEQANRQNFHFGAKLVRGAYMDQERERANVLQYEDPINPSYDATSDMYHKCLFEVLKRARDSSVGDGKGTHREAAIMVASHNEDTLKFALRMMAEFDLDPTGRTLCFGQLYGMCDHLSFPLGQSGFKIYKYIPYGPILEVMPYMSRRVAENGSSILQRTHKERKLLLKELIRRIMTLKLWYTPKAS